MPTSLEFVALCRSQISILTQGLGATFSVVYLMQQLGEETESQLVPVVAHPESAIGWQDPLLQLPSTTVLFPTSSQRLLPASAIRVEPELGGLSTPEARRTALPEPVSPAEAPADAIVTQRRIVLPLVQENVMLGLLVVGREDRGWSPGEQAQIDQIASTLAIACVLDQRYQWLEFDRQQERQIQAQQHDHLDNLLHQFRNSLTALQTFGKLILKRLQPDDRNREAASSLVRETIRLRELAQQLELAVQRPAPAPLALPASRPESGDSQLLDRPLLTGSLVETSLTITPLSVRAVLAPLLASAETIAQDRQLFLHTLIPENLPWVWADAQALREVLNNLIENALKYTPAGGHILVQVSLSDSTANLGAEKLEEPAPAWLELTISDTGPGIPAQDLPHIFERRFRGVQSQTDIPGTGLGLAIAKSLTEQMHGAIEVQSPAQIWETFGANTAIGTSLKLQLPIAAPVPHEIKHLTT